jgi:hypothetical protein
MPVLRFAARRAFGGLIAQQSSSGKQSAAGAQQEQSHLHPSESRSALSLDSYLSRFII